MGRECDSMKSHEMAEDYLRRAGRCLDEAEDAFNEDDYPMTIRRSQECIEFSIKGVLRMASIEFPREHDVSDVLINIAWKEIGSPDWFTDRIQDMARIMREITPKRGLAMYGFEKEMKPASAIFSREDGIKAFEDARFVFEICKRSLQEWKP
jgi:HEPN domain-containing protein